MHVITLISMCALNVLWFFFSLFFYGSWLIQICSSAINYCFNKICWICLFKLNKFVNFSQRYDPPSMCSKHVNGFPPHTTTSQIKTKFKKKIYNYVFIFDNFVFVNSSINHHYETQILHVLCFSFFVMVKKTKPYKLYVFCMFFYLFVFLSLFCSL